MRNITVAVDEETHRRARIRAAELDTSVSALVREFLRRLAPGAGRRERLEPQTLESSSTRKSVTLDVFRDAVAIRRRFGLSYWDAAILAAARTLGCDAVYSEDMSSEQDHGGIRVVNPL